MVLVGEVSLVMFVHVMNYCHPKRSTSVNGRNGYLDGYHSKKLIIEQGIERLNMF